MQCLVTGSTGYIGGRLIPELLARGHKVRAMARTTSKLDNVPWRSDVEVAQGDLTDPDSLTRAFDAVDVVFYLAHSMGTSEDFVEEERRTAMNVVEAAKKAGVRRVVYLSGLHPAGADLSRHLRSRTAVGDILLGSGIETIVLQAGVVIGSGSASFEMIRHLTELLPVMTTPKWVHNKIQPIAVRDVLHYLAESATATVPESRTWDIGGPDVLEYGEMMQGYAEAAGLHRRGIIVLPFLTPTIASWWVGLVTPIPPGLAQPLVESLHCDAVADEHDIDDVIAPPAGGLLPYREAVQRALEFSEQRGFQPSWSTDGPSGPRPSDPDWAGDLVLRDSVTGTTGRSPDAVWQNLTHRGHRWQAISQQSGSSARLRYRGRVPGVITLNVEVSPREDGRTEYAQTAEFAPRGLPGRLYALSVWQLRRRRWQRAQPS